MRLIAIGFNVVGTGLTRVMDSVLRQLADRHEIHFLGIGYSGEIIRDQCLEPFGLSVTDAAWLPSS